MYYINICPFNYISDSLIRDIKFIYLLLLFSAGAVFSQGFEPVAIMAPEGAYVLIGKDIPRDFVYDIYRQDSAGGEFTFIKTLKFNKNIDAFISDLNLSNSKNTLFEAPNKENLSQIWSYIVKTNSTDSVPLYGSVPYFQETLGAAYYDNSLKLGGSYIYKIVKRGVKISNIEKYTSPQKYAPIKAKLSLKSVYSNAD